MRPTFTRECGHPNRINLDRTRQRHRNAAAGVEVACHDESIVIHPIVDQFHWLRSVVLDLPGEYSSKGDARRDGHSPFKIDIASHGRKAIHVLSSAERVSDLHVRARQERIERDASACPELKLTAVPARDGLANGLVVVCGNRGANERRYGHRTRDEQTPHFNPEILNGRVIGPIVQRAGKGFNSRHEI